MPSTLQHYWQLASTSSQERLVSTKSLIESLTEKEKADGLLSSSIANSLDIVALSKEVEDVPFAKRVAEAERSLDENHSSEVTYAIRRLIKGLASHRDSSRLGFSVALCELIKQLICLPARHLVILVRAYSNPSGKVKGQEERDLLFAHLFGLYAILQSGIMTQEKLAIDMDAKDLIEAVWHIGKSKMWLRESSSFIIVEAVKIIANSAVPWKFNWARWLAEKLCEAKEIGPESIAIYLSLQKQFPTLIKTMPKLPLLIGRNLLASANLAPLAKILKDGAASDEEAKSLYNSSPGHTKVHFVWDMLLEESLVKGKTVKDSEKSPFSEVYRVIVDEGLFASTASDQRKSWGFQVFEKAIRFVDIDNIPFIFSNNFMRSLMNHLAEKDRMLHNAAQRCITAIVSIVRSQPDLGSVIIHQLTRSQSAPFDAVTGTKTVESILTCMGSEAAVQDYIDYLIQKANQPAKDDAHKSRRWALDQLASVARNSNLTIKEDSITTILLYLAGHGFFDVQINQTSSDDAAFRVFSQPLKPVFTPDVKNICQIRFFSCLADLNERKEIRSTDVNGSRKQHGLMKSGKSWISKAFELVSSLEAKSSVSSNLHHVQDQDPSAVIFNLRKRLSKVGQKAKNEETRSNLRDFELMMMSGLLYARTLDKQVSSKLVLPLIECGEALLKDIRSEGEGFDSSGLLIQCIVLFLEQPSTFLRSTATQAFTTFTGKFDQESLEQLLGHLGFNEEEAKETDGTDGDEGDDMQEDEIPEEEDFSDSVSVTSASSVSLGNDDTVDPILVAKLKEVLETGGAADVEGESSDQKDDTSDADDKASNFDDDQMMQIDDKLAEIFKQRLGSKKEEEQMKKEAVTLHIKILDLLDIFARQQSKNPLCIEMILPLLTITLEKDAMLGQLKQKAFTILQKTICKDKDGLNDCIDEDVILKPMEAVHRLATTQLTSEMSSLCTNINIYLTKACKGQFFTQGGKIKKLYKSTLDDFIDRKSNNLRPQFLIETFQKVPLLGFALREELLLASSGTRESAKESYRRWQILEMLRATLISLTNNTEKRKEVVAFLPKISRSIFQIVETQDFRLKEALKIALDLARLTKKLQLNQAEKEVIWPVDGIERCLSHLGKKKLANAASLQGLLRQLMAINKSDEGKKRERDDELNDKNKDKKMKQ